jgi:cytochrome c peroxidase
MAKRLRTGTIASRLRNLAACVPLVTLALAGCGAPETLAEGDEVVSTKSALEPQINRFGVGESFHTTGTIDRTNPFFQMLGANQRTCETCHGANQAWGLSSVNATLQFLLTGGQAPLFMLHDAGSRPDADISTLLGRLTTFGATTAQRGLIRFGRTIPATSEFTVTAVQDPAGFATPAQITNFRRPTPTVNEAKVANILWTAGPHDVPTQVAGLVSGAAVFHEQRVGAVPADQVAAARDFQLGLFFAQTLDFDAGALDAAGAHGGPANLAAQPFHVGINDIQGLDPSGAPFTRHVFDLYDAWATFDAIHGPSGHNCNRHDTHLPLAHRIDASRGAIYRGQQIFNNVEFNITGVPGLNDVLGQTTVVGTCSTCHNAPNVGGHSVFRLFNTGTTAPSRCSSVLPLLTLQNKTTGEVLKTCDMGRGGNGVWADLGKFRAPPLRGLAARAPYFHDGQAAQIEDVIQYYVQRFDVALTSAQKEDLTAFLAAL